MPSNARLSRRRNAILWAPRAKAKASMRRTRKRKSASKLTCNSSTLKRTSGRTKRWCKPKTLTKMNLEWAVATTIGKIATALTTVRCEVVKLRVRAKKGKCKSMLRTSTPKAKVAKCGMNNRSHCRKVKSLSMTGLPTRCCTDLKSSGPACQ